MLIILVRVVFVVLAVLIGLTSGHYFYENWAAGVPSWFGGAIGFGVAITLIAAEHAFRRRFTRSLVAFLVGLGAGLLLSTLLLVVLRLVLQDSDLYHNLDLPLALVTTYLVLVTVVRNADRFRVVVPFVEFRSEGIVAGCSVLDSAALTDGRLLGLLEAGLLDHRLLVPRSLLAQAESDAASSEIGAQMRGQRALETMAELRERLGERLVVDDTEIPQAGSQADEVIGLSRLEGARVVSADHELVERAKVEGLRVLDLQSLASRLAPVLRSGQNLSVALEKPGEGADQAVGFLDDGSMVVVSGGAANIGQTVTCTVLRLHQTANGRMVFAELRSGGTDSFKKID